MRLAWDNYRNGGGAKLTLLALCDWANDDGGSCHPSIESIARKVCASPSQARRHVRALEQEGYLQVVGNQNGGAPGATRRYQISVLKLRETPIADASPTPSADDTPTPSTGARAGMDARDPLHGCAQTPGMGASQTIIDPSVIHQLPDSGNEKQVSRKERLLAHVVALLKKQSPNQNPHSFLSLLFKKAGEVEVLQALEALEKNPPAEARSWLLKFLEANAKPTSKASTASRLHLATQDYLA